MSAGSPFRPTANGRSSSHSDRRVRLWDLARFREGQGVARLPGPRRPQRRRPVVAYSPDGRYVATARLGRRRRLAVERGEGDAGPPPGDGRRVLRRPLPARRRPLLAFTGTISNDWNVHIHEVETGKELPAARRPPHAVTCVVLGAGRPERRLRRHGLASAPVGPGRPGAATRRRRRRRLGRRLSPPTPRRRLFLRRRLGDASPRGRGERPGANAGLRQAAQRADRLRGDHARRPVTP